MCHIALCIFYVLYYRKAIPLYHRSDGNTFLARVLQYLETPQYLRKQLFPMHPDLKLVGKVLSND